MSIDPVVKKNVSHRDVAKDLWDHLKKRFSVMNGPKLQQLKSELACCKQRGLTIETYYGKLTKIWDSMASFQTGAHLQVWWLCVRSWCSSRERSRRRQSS